MAASTGLSHRSTIGMDVFYIEAVVDQLQSLVTGASVKKIHQPDADTIILRLWNGRRELRLRISATVGATCFILPNAPGEIRQIPHELVICCGPGSS